MAIRRRTLDEVLQDRGLAPEALADARKTAEKTGSSLLETVQRGDVSQLAVTRGLADLTGLRVLESIDLERIDIELVRRIPLGLAREQQILPLWIEEDGRVLAGIASPSCLPSADDMRVVVYSDKGESTDAQWLMLHERRVIYITTYHSLHKTAIVMCGKTFWQP